MTVTHRCAIPLHDGDTDPNALHGLDQAVFVMEKLCDGAQKEILSSQLHNDKQLVELWASFLRHNHWIAYDPDSGKWTMTQKGKNWILELRQTMID